MKTIAIIGGGPAGAVAAETLARGVRDLSRARAGPAGPNHMHGQQAQAIFDPQSVLQPGTRIVVFEEKLGWEKPCGGGLPAKALRRYPFLRDASDPHTLVHDLELVADQGEAVRFRLREPIAIYSRAVLNGLLLRRAAQAGAEIVEDRILRFGRSTRGWQLEGRRKPYKADFLVLGAGARTRLRAPLAEHFAQRDFMLTFGYYAPASDHLMRVQFFEDFEGYAWSFPRTDHLSLGVCGKADQASMAELRDKLDRFISRFHYTAGSNGCQRRPPVFSHVLPALSSDGWDSLKVSGAGWAFVGDAAGLVDPVTGEGIYFAMRSGELLAESLLTGAPESYPPKLWDEFGRKLAMGSRLPRLFYREEFLGRPSTTRLVQFAGHSGAFMNLLQNLVEGSQSYAGLISKVYNTFGRSLVELGVAALRNKFGVETEAG